MNCSGRHRSYGVSTSRVRSIDLDSWSHTQVLAVLEGGNEQMKQFFHRHQMNGETDEELDFQYKTKAAHFYKTHLQQHITRVAESGVYRGREVARNLKKKHPRQGDVNANYKVSIRRTSIEVQ